MRMILVLVLFAGACGGPSSVACTPGESRACTCSSGAMGAQVCADDGSRLEACACDELDGGAPRDAGLDAGSGADASTPSADAGHDAAMDAGADGGAIFMCNVGGCDPRFDSRGCSDGGVCMLWNEVASCELPFGSSETSCDAVTDCAPGFACFDAPGGSACGAICCPGDPEACGTGMRCAGSGLLVDGTATDWGRCLPVRSCDVLRPADSCEAREGCYITGAGATECRHAGDGGPGALCAIQEDCQAGFFCGGVGESGRCIRVCMLDLDDCPPSEGHCIAQTHSPPGTGFCGT